MRLFYTPGACSLAPHIVVHETGLDVEAVKVTLNPPPRVTAKGEDYYTINPKGAVPALEISPGEVLTENAIIMQYLASQKPEAKLLPESGLPRYRVLEAANFVSTEIHKSFSPIFNPKLTPEWRAGIITNINNKIGTLEKILGDKEFLAGAFSIADAYAYTILRWADRFEGVVLPPKVAEYRRRVGERPKVKEALEAEGLKAVA
jgi:glutathione S-transferase